VRKYRTDYLLWALATASVVAALAVCSASRSEKWPHRLRWIEVGFDHVDFVRLSWNAVPVAVGAAMVGWGIHAALLRCGLRLSARPTVPQAGDYADPPDSDA
jgi:hypothetical protein